MANTLDSEQEQIDAIKAWWKENGRVITVGLVLGLGGVFGWSYWQSSATAKAERASVVYEAMVNWAMARNYAQSNELADTLMRDFSTSSYGALAGLVRANNAFADNHPDEARGFLQWVIENARREELKNIARLRGARLAADSQEYDTALSMLDAATDPAHFLGAYEELRGDIMVAQNDPERAINHYLNALQTQGGSDSQQARIQMKLNNLGRSAGE